MTVRSDEPVIGFQLRKSLAEVVDELLVGVADPIPVGHVCRSSRWAKCSHEMGAGASLLGRLAELAIPAQEMLPATDGPKTSGGRRSGSPAPWCASAAELSDEILRGALAEQRRARRALGLDDNFTITLRRGDYLHGEKVQVPWRNVGLDAAGSHALRALPGLIRLLNDQDHPLGVRISPSGRRTQGPIEDMLRSWHQRALALTGHRLPLERLPDIPNPDHPWAAEGPRLKGPVCESLLCEHDSCYPVRASRHGARLGPVCASCGHESCRRIRATRRRWIRWTCLACGSDSLRRDPVTDRVHCLRPSCVDDQGLRSEWSMGELQFGSSDPWGDRAW